jgi:hypothetical protein
MSLKLLQKTEMSFFFKMSKEDQQAFMAKVKINELKNKAHLPFLKKFIAMKVLMEARCAAEDHKLFNLTAKFRDLLAFITKINLNLCVLNRGDDVRKDSDRIPKNGYQLSYIHQIGLFSWNSKLYKLDVDEENNIITEKVTRAHKEYFISRTTNVTSEQIITWSQLNEEDYLKALFAEIKKETNYENTFGYDLFCVAIYVANTLLMMALMQDYKPLFIPLALTLNLAIYALIIPPVLIFTAIEHMIINPIKWIIDLALPEHEDFIEEVTSLSL